MLRRLIRPTATLLLLLVSYSQNLYAFTGFIPSQLPGPSVVAIQIPQPAYTNKGTSLGIDSRITSLVSLPLSGAINAKLTGESIVNSIMDGVLRGGVTLGVEFATQDLDPLVGALTARAVTGAIAGGLSKDHDIFKGIFDAYAESTGNLLTLDGPGTDSWSQALYLSKIMDFSDLIKQKGLAQALETYATSVFYRDSVEQLIQTSGSVLNYFQTAMTNPQSLPVDMRPIPTTYNGVDALFVPTGGGDYLIVSADGQRIFAQSKGSYYSEGTYGIDDRGNWVLTDGVGNQYTDEGIITLDIESGSLRSAEFESYDGAVAYDITGNDHSAIRFDSSGDFNDVVIHNLNTDSKVVIKDGQYFKNTTAYNIEEALSQSEPWYQKFALSNAADFTDQKLDEIATWMLGDAQDNMGWILGATALNSAKDILKGALVDTLRFGSSLPGAIDDFSGAWQAAKNGDPLSAGYQALLGSGKILQEFGRATVVLGAVKGLAVSAVRLEGQAGLATARKAIPKLSDDLADTFRSGRYNSYVLQEDTVLYRAGSNGESMGQFFSFDKPISEVQVRIDKAILPRWPGGGVSPIDTVFEVKIPKGTVVHVGEAGYQNGFYIGGTQQVVIQKPSLIRGVKILDKWPIKK